MCVHVSLIGPKGVCSLNSIATVLKKKRDWIWEKRKEIQTVIRDNGNGPFENTVLALLVILSSCPILDELRSIVITMSQCCRIFVLHAWMSHVLCLAAATFKLQAFADCFPFFFCSPLFAPAPQKHESQKQVHAQNNPSSHIQSATLRR